MEAIRKALGRYCSDGRINYYSITEHETKPKTYSIRGEKVWNPREFNEILAAAKHNHEVLSSLHHEVNGTFLIVIKEKA